MHPLWRPRYPVQAKGDGGNAASIIDTVIASLPQPLSDLLQQRREKTSNIRKLPRRLARALREWVIAEGASYYDDGDTQSAERLASAYFAIAVEIKQGSNAIHRELAGLRPMIAHENRFLGSFASLACLKLIIAQKLVRNKQTSGEIYSFLEILLDPRINFDIAKKAVRRSNEIKAAAMSIVEALHRLFPVETAQQAAHIMSELSLHMNFVDPRTGEGMLTAEEGAVLGQIYELLGTWLMPGTENVYEEAELLRDPDLMGASYEDQRDPLRSEIFRSHEQMETDSAKNIFAHRAYLSLVRHFVPGPQTTNEIRELLEAKSVTDPSSPYAKTVESILLSINKELPGAVEREALCMAGEVRANVRTLQERGESLDASIEIAFNEVERYASFVSWLTDYGPNVFSEKDELLSMLCQEDAVHAYFAAGALARLSRKIFERSKAMRDIADTTFEIMRRLPPGIGTLVGAFLLKEVASTSCRDNPLIYEFARTLRETTLERGIFVETYNEVFPSLAEKFARGKNLDAEIQALAAILQNEAAGEDVLEAAEEALFTIDDLVAPPKSEGSGNSSPAASSAPPAQADGGSPPHTPPTLPHEGATLSHGALVIMQIQRPARLL